MFYATLRYAETFFDKWSAESAYILGLFASDGCMYLNKRGSSYIAFTFTDYQLITIIQNLLRVTNKIEEYHRVGNFKTSYTIQIGSKALYSKFLNLGFTPAKSKTLVFPPVPDEFICHFIRGYFDGDGSIYTKISQRKNRKGIIHYLILNLRCGSKMFLETIRTKLHEQAGIGLGSLYFHSSAYSLAYSGKDVVELYDFLYPSSGLSHLERKRVSYEKGIRSRLRP